MIRYCQQDTRWATTKMHPSNLTLGRYGCTTTAICMVRSIFFPTETFTPLDAIRSLRYTADGLVKWKESDYRGMAFVSRNYGDNLKIPEYIRSGAGVILEVNGCHWVACAGVNIFGKPIIYDPWDGNRHYVWPKKYKITGYAIFRKS